MDECYAFNPVSVHLYYALIGPIVSLVLLCCGGFTYIKKAYPWPARLRRYVITDNVLFYTQCAIIGYLLYTRYHMENLPTLTLPCHLGLIVNTLMVSRWQDNRYLWYLFSAWCIPLAGGGAMGIIFRDPATWGAYKPPWYDEIFYIQHVMVYVVFHYVFLFKFQFLGRPYQIPYNPIRYSLLGVVPAWAIVHYVLWIPLSLLTGFNLHYVLCPMGGLRTSWPLPAATWPASFSILPMILGCLYYLGFELPLIYAFATYVLGVKQKPHVE